MTQEEYLAAAENVVYLAACMVKGEKPDAERVRQMDLEQLYSTASRHLLTGIVGYALEAAGVHDRAFTQAKSKAVRKVVLFDTERTAILAELEKAGIWHMPLKGSVLKDFYPQIGMRQMADHDILIDPSRVDDVKCIMESLGYSTKRFGKGVHDNYIKKPVWNFEMHWALFRATQVERLEAYYRDVKARLIKDEENDYGYHFSPDDFYIYMIAHEYKHYSFGGTGLRSLLDTYVYLIKQPLDMGYVAEETEKLGIREFEENNRSLALHLFNGEELTEADREMLDYILSSGTYGHIVHKVENKMRRKGWSKVRYALHRFIVPVSRKNPDYMIYAGAYPFFYRHRILLPLLPFYRTFRAIRNGRLRSETRAILKARQK